MDRYKIGESKDAEKLEKWMNEWAEQGYELHTMRTSAAGCGTFTTVNYITVIMEKKDGQTDEFRDGE